MSFRHLSYAAVLCCRMDRVIASILVLIAAFILQYLWQYYRTMTDEDGVAISVDVAEQVSHRDEPHVLSVQVFSCDFLHYISKLMELLVIPGGTMQTAPCLKQLGSFLDTVANAVLS